MCPVFRPFSLIIQISESISSPSGVLFLHLLLFYLLAYIQVPLTFTSPERIPLPVDLPAHYQECPCGPGPNNHLPYCLSTSFGPRQANLVLIAYASSEGSGEPAHPRSLARTFAARSYKQWIKRNLQTESQIPGPSEWLGMRSWNLSWRNVRRHKFAWRGSFDWWAAW